ncbi:hypothetical protein ABMA57_01850 [Saccharospirillum sp. HFRX-1]|uniref:hypothetical protein n=1 Tax=unclassified Saccharospirillum TaxID=2633430 RepID=UPI00371AEDBD
MNMIESSYGKKYIAEIPSAGNNVSDSLLATSLKMGPTVPSDNLLAHLQQVEPGIPTIVTSDSDVLAAATLERALKDGEGSIDGKKVVFVGGAQFQENLIEAANQANIELEFLVIPES